MAARQQNGTVPSGASVFDAITAALTLQSRLSNPLKKLLATLGHGALSPSNAIALAGVGRGVRRLEDLVRRGFYAGAEPSVFNRSMQDQGLIEVRPVAADKRALELHLTDAGTKAVNDIERISSDLGEELVRLGITAEDLATFIRTGNALLSASSMLQHRRSAFG